VSPGHEAAPAVICCLLCGKTGLDLPTDHGCRPNLPPDQMASLERGREDEESENFYDLWVKRHDKPRGTTAHRESSGTPQARVLGLSRTVSSATPGTRNATLFRAACRVAEMVARGELRCPDEAWTALVYAGAQAGLYAAEIAATIESARTSSGVAS
jgi:hypothetical protein